MHELEFVITVAASGLAGLAMLVAAGLSGWRSWLALKRHELTVREQVRPNSPHNNAVARIELADLKERLKKLEAIAAGVDL